MASARPPTRDEWVLGALADGLTADQARELRAAAAPSLWEAVLERKWLADEEIAEAVAARYRLKRNDLFSLDPRAKDFLPEGLARKYQVIPLAVTDSAVDIATADPLDLKLPRLDGYGVLSHLRARPATAKLPVIVLTAKGDEESEVRTFEVGATDYLTKLFRVRALSARINAMLERAVGRGA
ncbi:MAG: response regulator [Gemmatimonadota bacterium]